MMVVLGIYRIAVPISAVFAAQPWNSVEYPQEQRSSQSAAFLQMSALELCFLFFDPLATSFPVLMSAGASPAALDVINV